jgi:4-hydroxybenzoate polyprenyltransferase
MAPRVAEQAKSAPSGALAVLGAGLRYAALLVSGAAPELGDRRAFAVTVTAALRPHFFVFPAGAALVGASAARSAPEPWRIALAAAAAGLGWGVGQLLNDLLDVDADAIDAPHRPAVRGLLPLGPTAAVALALGAIVTAATLAVHPAALFFVVVAPVLLAAYAPAKRIPLLGNLTHGALVATAAAIGLAAAMPDRRLELALRAGVRELAYTGLVAALYLQANYEKDRAGDARAGYRTLAHVLGVRGSAALRTLAAPALAGLAWHWGLVAGVPALVLVGLGVALTLAGALRPLSGGDDRASLAGYRWSVHATAAFMLAPVARMSPALAGALALASALLVERAFQKSPNP